MSFWIGVGVGTVSWSERAEDRRGGAGGGGKERSDRSRGAYNEDDLRPWPSAITPGVVNILGQLCRWQKQYQ